MSCAGGCCAMTEAPNLLLASPTHTDEHAWSLGGALSCPQTASALLGSAGPHERRVSGRGQPIQEPVLLCEM